MVEHFVELSSLLETAASLDDEIRDICRARDDHRFLQLVASYQHRIQELSIGEFLFFGGGTMLCFSVSSLSCPLVFMLHSLSAIVCGTVRRMANNKGGSRVLSHNRKG